MIATTLKLGYVLSGASYSVTLLPVCDESGCDVCLAVPLDRFTQNTVYNIRN